MNKKKLFIIIGVVVVVGVFVVVALQMDGSSATKVYAQEVKLQTITEEVSASGRIQPQTQVNITAEVNAEIIALPVKEGQFVNAGDLLVVLDTVQTGADLEQAKYRYDEIQAHLSAAKTTMEQNKEEFDRHQRLFDQSLTSETAFKNARYAYLNSQASYEGMEAQASQVKAAYDKQIDYYKKSRIRAPMTGVISYLDCEVGEIAAAQTAYSQGKTLMTISDLSVFEVEVEVDETEINKVELGQKSMIEVDAIPDTSFAGQVVEIGNTAVTSAYSSSDQTTNFQVKVTFLDPSAKLRPGMSATVDITTAEVDSVPAVPFSSVVMRRYDMDSVTAARLSPSPSSGDVHAAEDEASAGDDSFTDGEEREELKGVFVAREGRAQFVPVTTGVADRKDIQVTEGLQAGDSVISGPYRLLRTIKDNDPVEVIEKVGTITEQEG